MDFVRSVDVIYNVLEEYLQEKKHLFMSWNRAEKTVKI